MRRLFYVSRHIYLIDPDRPMLYIDMYSDTCSNKTRLVWLWDSRLNDSGFVKILDDDYIIDRICNVIDNELKV